MDEHPASNGFSLPPYNLKGRVRQPRTVYSVEQKEELERSFQNNHYPSYEEREMLAARLNLQEQQVQVWFKNRRAKYRKTHETTQEERRAAVPLTQVPGVGVPAHAPVPAPAASAPGFSGDASGPGFSGVVSGPGISRDAKAPGEAAFMGDPSFYSPPPPNAFRGTEISASSYMQAWWCPTQDAQNPVPAAATTAAAAALALAGAPVRPEERYTSSLCSDLLERPTLADLLSSQDPLEGPSSLQSGCPEDEESGGEDNYSPKKYLNL